MREIRSTEIYDEFGACLRHPLSEKDRQLNGRLFLGCRVDQNHLIFQFWDLTTLAFRRLPCYNVLHGPLASSGNVTDEIVREYIEKQEIPKPDDNFGIVNYL